MRIGICDTTFARFDMAAVAIDELKNNATDLTIIRETVPGVKDFLYTMSTSGIPPFIYFAF